MSPIPRLDQQGRPTCRRSTAQWTWTEVPSCLCLWASDPCFASTGWRCVRAPPPLPALPWTGPAILPGPPHPLPIKDCMHTSHWWHQTPGVLQQPQAMPRFSEKDTEVPGGEVTGARSHPGASGRPQLPPIPCPFCTDSHCPGPFPASVCPNTHPHRPLSPFRTPSLISSPSPAPPGEWPPTASAPDGSGCPHTHRCCSGACET